jgi:Ubiquitin family
MVDTHSDKLHDIKKKIQSKEGIHPDQQILLLNGIRQDGSVSNPHIYDGACLFLTLRNRGG